MSFLRPSSVTTATGFFDYGDIIPSYFLDYLDNNFQNCLDKTGDTITGNLEFLTGSSLTFDTGSNVFFNSGSNLFTYNTTWDFGGTLNIDNFTTGVAHLNIINGASFGVDAFSTVNIAGVATFSSGSFLEFNTSVIGINSGTGIVISGGSTVDVQTACTVQFEVGSVLNVSVPPTFIVPQNKNTVQFFCEGVAALDEYASNHWLVRPADLSIYDNYSSRSISPVWIVPLDFIDKSFVINVSITLQTAGTSYPATPASIQIVRMPFSGGSYQSMLSSSPFVVPSSAYSGTLTQLNITVDQNQTIDLTNYSYALILTDDSGAGSIQGNRFFQIQSLCANILGLNIS